MYGSCPGPCECIHVRRPPDVSDSENHDIFVVPLEFVPFSPSFQPTDMLSMGIEKRESTQNALDTGFSVHGVFKLDHLQPVEAILL